jgi:hypothetical protein
MKQIKDFMRKFILTLMFAVLGTVFMSFTPSKVTEKAEITKEHVANQLPSNTILIGDFSPETLQALMETFKSSYIISMVEYPGCGETGQATYTEHGTGWIEVNCTYIGTPGGGTTTCYQYRGGGRWDVVACP